MKSLICQLLLAPALLLTLAGAETVFAQDSLNIRCLGRVLNDQWEECHALDTEGNLVYAATGLSGLRILDIQNVEAPVEVGYYPLHSRAGDLDVEGSFAYVADLGFGLSIINIRNPSNPFETGTYPDPLVTYYSIDVAGDYAYLALGLAGLRILRVADRTAPTLVTTLDTPGFARKVRVFGQFAYVMDSDSGVHIFNIANPAQAFLVGSYDTDDPAHDIAIYSGYACVATWTGGLTILDISDPTDPELVTTHRVGTLAGSLAMRGTRLYVADAAYGVRVVDFSNPLRPLNRGGVAAPDTPQGVISGSDYILTALGAAGLQMLSPQEGSSPPVVLGSYRTGSAFGIVTAGTRGYVADGDAGLKVLNLQNPGSPRVQGTLDTPASARDVAVAGFHVYIADRTGGLRVADVRQPQQPVEVGVLDRVYSVASVQAGPSEAWVADAAIGLRIVDISDPTQPVVTGTVTTPGYTNDATVSGGYAYLADGFAGLRVIDLSAEPPAEVGFLDSAREARAVAVEDSLACIADDRYGLLVVGVQNPAQPVLMARITSLYAVNVTLTGRKAYVACGQHGIRVFDLTNPREPQEVAYYNTPGIARAIAVAGDYLYVADGTNVGAYQLQAASPMVPRPVRSADFALGQNYPNPFNPTTTITYQVPAPGPVKLSVFNVLGQQVATLQDGFKAAGTHRVDWTPVGLASGAYIYTLQTDGTTVSRSMILAK